MSQTILNEAEIDTKTEKTLKSILRYIRNSATQTKEVSDDEMASTIEAELNRSLVELGVKE